MIVQESFLKKIKDFGLNSYEAKIWTALLSRGVSTAGELSDIANVPRSRSYDILESLEKKGFIMMKIGKPIKYIAIPPEEVVERVKKRIASEAVEKSKTLDEIKKSDVLKNLNSLHNEGIETSDPADMTGVVKGRNQIYNHLNTMIKNASHSIILMTTEEGMLRKNKHISSALKKASKKGVKIKIMAPITKKSESAVNEFKKYADVSHVQDLKGRFCIIDNQELAFMLEDDSKVHPDYDMAVWVNTPIFASTVGKAITSCKA